MMDVLQNIVKEIADLKSIVTDAMENVTKQKDMKCNKEERRLRMEKEVKDDPVKNWGKECLREAGEKKFRLEELKNLKAEAKKNGDKVNILAGERRQENDKEVQEGPLERILSEMDSKRKHRYNAVSAKHWGEECLREPKEKKFRLEKLKKLEVEAKKNGDKADILAGERRQEKDKEVKEGSLELSEIDSPKKQKYDAVSTKNREKQYLREAKTLFTADAIHKASKLPLEEKKKTTVEARKDADKRHADEYFIRLEKKKSEDLVAKHRVDEVVKPKARETKGKNQHVLRRVKTNRKLFDLFGGSDTENDDKRSMPMIIHNRKSGPSQPQSSAKRTISQCSHSSDSCVISRRRPQNDNEDEEESLYLRRYTKTLCRPPPRKMQDFS